MPADNPVNAIDWNGEKRRDTGMGTSDLKGWFAELAALDNPIRREFHLFTLLSGCRPTALQGIQPSHVNFGRRMVHIPMPKGGTKRAFDIPLSREMVLCLVRTMRFGRQMYPSQAAEWIFPADSASGHLVEQKEDRATLSKWGNDLRQSFRTIATAAGVSEFDAKLLMNHAIPGVNAGYITRHKLLEDHLRSQQQAISSAVFAALAGILDEKRTVRDWLIPGATCRILRNAKLSQVNEPAGTTEVVCREAAQRLEPKQAALSRAMPQMVQAIQIIAPAMPYCLRSACRASVSRSGPQAAKRGRGTRQRLEGLTLVRPACPKADRAFFLTHSPSPSFRANDQSTPPPGMTMPQMWRPTCCSRTGRQGTRLNPRPSSIMANRPLDSWVEPTS